MFSLMVQSHIRSEKLLPVIGAAALLRIFDQTEQLICFGKILAGFCVRRIFRFFLPDTGVFPGASEHKAHLPQLRTVRIGAVPILIFNCDENLWFRGFVSPLLGKQKRESLLFI